MNTLVMKSIFGSKLYGTDTPESDLDYKGVYIPSAKSLILGNVIDHYSKNTSNSDVKNTSDDIDEEMFSLKYFIEMAIKGETIALDMIHTPSELIVDYDDIGPWDFIYQNRSKFYTTDMKAYLGYVKKQAAKYGIKGSRLSALRQVKEWASTLPDTKEVNDFEENNKKRVKNVSWIDGKMCADTLIGDFFSSAPIINEHTEMTKIDGNDFYKVLSSNYQNTLSVKRFKLSINKMWDGYGERARLAELNQGVDWKSLHHAIRGGLQLKEIYSTGDLQYPLKDRDFLMDVKKGKIPFKHVSESLNDLISEVDGLASEAYKNGMPKQVDKKFWDDFIYNVHLEQIKRAM